MTRSAFLAKCIPGPARIALGAAAVLIAAPGAAQAEWVDRTVSGHRLRYQTGPDLDESGPTLTFGNTIKLRDPFVVVEKVHRIGDATVVVGASGPGGNACNPTPFIMAVRPGEEPELYRPQDVCKATTIVYERNAIIITEYGVAGDRLRTWTWTAEGGLERREAVKAASSGKGWKSIAARKVTHPSEILEHAEFSAELKRMLGKDFVLYREQLVDLGSARYEGDFLFGSACVKLDCEATGAFIGLDLKTRGIYAAFKPVDRGIVESPAPAQWPAPLRGPLREWAAAWR